jgi:hypothetical protein
MSGCDKLLRHGRPVNAVAEDKGSEGVPTQSLTSDTPNASASEPSNTPIPIPEPSKSAPPASGNVASSAWFSRHWCFPTINVNNSVLYWAFNAVGYAAIAVICAVVYRLISPAEEYIQGYIESDEDVSISLEEVGELGYRICDVGQEDTISYTWYLFKKVTSRFFYTDADTKEELKGIPIITNDNVEAYKAYKYGIDYSRLYKPNPAT